MAKPTEDLDWATDGGATDILEPTTGQRTSGVVEGGSWTRRRLNWMFNGLGKWIDYLKDNVLELGTGDAQARNNLENDGRFLSKDNNLSDLQSPSNASLNLGISSVGWQLQVAGITSDNYIVDSNKPTGVCISPDGLNLYIRYRTGNLVKQYTLTTSHLLTSAVDSGNSLDTGMANGSGLDISPDGTKLLNCIGATNEVVEYTMSVPFDLSTATQTTVLTYTAPEEAVYSYDGTKLYIVSDAGTGEVSYYTLPTPYTLSSAVFVRVRTGYGDVGGIALSKDGANMFVSDDNGLSLKGFLLEEPNNIANVRSLGIDLPLTPAASTDLGGFGFSREGEWMYCLDRGEGVVCKYSTKLTTSIY